tara:strand:- start:668 stop:826 length:159 start_codon:yes stop_codon:yes gene_type:complete
MDDQCIEHNIELNDKERAVCDASLSEVILDYGVKNATLLFTVLAIVIIYYNL